MSYRTVGYIDGKPIRIDEGPAHVASSKIGGSLVIGDPGSVELHRLAANAKRDRERSDPERYERRQATWHASKVRTGHATDC